MPNKPSYEELEDALRESEERYRAVVDNIKFGISVINPKMEILSLNKQMRDWLPKIDISKKPICYKTFNTPSRQEICPYCPTVKAINDGKPHESVINTPSGNSTISYRIIATPIIDKEGTVVSAIEMLEDVTEKVEAEEALKESENILQSIFRAAPVGIGLVKDRILIKANERLCEIIGYERQELINKSARILYPTEEEFKWVDEEKYRQINEKGTGTVETRWVRKDGKVIDILLSSTPLDPSDHLAGITLTALDVSDRKQAERNLGKLIKELQKTLDEIKTLRGIIPICSFCKKIRNDKGYWDQVEVYVKHHTHADFSHSFCPECAKKHYPEYFEHKVATSKFSYEIKPDQNLILSHCRGGYSLEEIIKCCDAVYSDHLFRRGMNDIIDLSHALVNINYDQVKRLCEYIKNIEKDRGECRIAVVTNDDPVFGIITILKMLTEDSIIHISPFKSHEEAKAWVTSN